MEESILNFKGAGQNGSECFALRASIRFLEGACEKNVHNFECFVI